MQNFLILDFYDLVQSNQLEKIAHIKSNLPDFVKNTKIMDQSDLNKLSNDDFALRIVNEDGSQLRKYAINDAGNTYLSTLSFWQNKHKLSDGAQKIAAYYLCKSFEKYPQLSQNIPDKLIKLAKEIHNTNIYFYTGKEKKPLIPLKSKYAVEYTYHGKEMKAFPLSNIEEVKTAKEDFPQMYSWLPLEVRRESAKLIKKACLLKGISVRNSLIEKYASNDWEPQIEKYLYMRNNCLKTDKQKRILREMIEKRASFSPSEFVEILKYFDKEMDIHRYYDSKISDPYYSVFGAKTASNEKLLEIDEGRLRDFATSDGVDKLKEFFDDHIVEEFKITPVETFSNLASPYRSQIVEIINST